LVIGQTRVVFYAEHRLKEEFLSYKKVCSEVKFCNSILDYLQNMNYIELLKSQSFDLPTQRREVKSVERRKIGE
jgi:hypothetical protein